MQINNVEHSSTNSIVHITVICLINCAQTCVKFCTYSKNSSTFEDHNSQMTQNENLLWSYLFFKQYTDLK